MAKSSKTPSSGEPERPRSEPEIMPPDRGGYTSGWPPRGDAQSGFAQSGFTETHGRQRIFVGRIGPLGFILLMLIVALFGGILLLALIGAALIWIPVVAVLVIIAAISGLFRRL
jgi:hypothetical protein